MADSQAEPEFIHKRASAGHVKEIAEIRRLPEKTGLQIQKTQRQFDHITKVLTVEESECLEEKLDEAGIILSRKRKK